MVEHLWRSMDWFGRGNITLLTAMLVNALVVIWCKFFRYSIARKQTRAFVHDATDALRDGRFDEVIAIAGRNDWSHVARVVAAGLTAFASTPPLSAHAEASEAALRAIRRTQNMQRAHLRVGIGTLTTIASSAPFIGLLGTCFGILYAFRGAAMEKYTWIARVNSDLATSLVTAALGLFVAIPAMWCRNWLRDRMDVFDTEMSSAAIETVLCLDAHRQWRQNAGHSTLATTDFVSGLAEVTAVRSWEAPYDRQGVVLIAIWTYWIYIALSPALR